MTLEELDDQDDEDFSEDKKDVEDIEWGDFDGESSEGELELICQECGTE